MTTPSRHDRAVTSFDAKSRKILTNGGTVVGGNGATYKYDPLTGLATVVRWPGGAVAKPAAPATSPVAAAPAAPAAGPRPRPDMPGPWRRVGDRPVTDASGSAPRRPGGGAGQTGPGGGVTDGPVTSPARPGETPAERAARERREADDKARQNDARARIGSVLAEYGLESLADFVWQQILAGKSDAEVLQDLRNTPQFKQRFPAIEERQKKGLNAISPGEYVAYERQARQLMRAAGLPEGFYDSNDDFTRYIAGDMSLAELQDRIVLGRKAMYEVDPQVRATLSRDYGISEGDLTAWFLDDKVAQPLLEKRFLAGTIGASASRSGFGITSREENEGLAEIGVTADQAQEGFSTLAGLRELTSGLPGQREEDISREDQIGAAFRGDARSRTKIENRRSQRQATFRGGGGFASDRDGVSGLGQAEAA